MEVEAYHWLNNILIIVSKNYWRMLKLVRQSMMKYEEVIIVSKYLPPKESLIIKRKLIILESGNLADTILVSNKC